MPTVLAKLGIMKENKDFGNKNSNPTTMAQVEAQCLLNFNEDLYLGQVIPMGF